MQHISRETLARWNLQMQWATDVWALLCCLASQHQPLYNKPAGLPGRGIAREQPQLAPSDCLTSSHTLTLQPQQRPYPNHTNFPFLPAQNYSTRRQGITHIVCWFRFFQKATLAWVSCLLGWMWYEIIARSQMSSKFEEMIAINAEKKRHRFSFRGRYFQSESHVCTIKKAPTDKTQRAAVRYRLLFQRTLTHLFQRE